MHFFTTKYFHNFYVFYSTLFLLLLNYTLFPSQEYYFFIYCILKTSTSLVGFKYFSFPTSIFNCLHPKQSNSNVSTKQCYLVSVFVIFLYYSSLNSWCLLHFFVLFNFSLSFIPIFLNPFFSFSLKTYIMVKKFILCYFKKLLINICLFLNILNDFSIHCELYF